MFPAAIKQGIAHQKVLLHKRGVTSPIKTASIYNIVSTGKEQRTIAKEFKQGIRSYNSALSFTFMNVDLDRRYANEKHGAYVFRIHASVHHLMSPELIPNSNNAIQQPRFAQIYIFDSANELQNRLNVAGNSGVRPHTMQLLQNIMHDISLFVEIFKTMEKLNSE